MTVSAGLAEILARPDIAPLAGGVGIDCGETGGCAFVVRGPHRVVVSAAILASGPVSGAASEADAAGFVRHALELCFLLPFVPDDPVLAGLMAARCAALFRTVDFPPAGGSRPNWHAAMAAGTAPALDQLQALWPDLAPHQPGAPQTVTRATAGRLAGLWPLIGPTEALIATGGDTRLHVEPDTGLNAYGCSPRPRPWAITFASSTASSISERGYEAAEAARRRVLGEALAHGVEDSLIRDAARVRGAIAGYYGLSPGVHILIVPSGTDGELLALAVALAGDPGRPLTNLLVGPEESGSGVPQAAAGRHFSSVTARGIAVAKGGMIDGVPASLEVASVPVRTAAGLPRAAAEIASDCAGQTAAAVAGGRRVLFHVLDQSKTGLLAPDPAGAGWPVRSGAVDVIVDACQARLTAAAVRGYLEQGAMVLLTGSKFFTGPPFAGALLIPAAIAPRLDDTRNWPAGFTDYFGATAGAAGGWPFPEGTNFSIALRWHAALAEMAAFAAVGAAEVAVILGRIGSRIETAIKANPDLVWHEPPALDRRHGPDGWDRLPTIFLFSVRAPGEGGGEGPRRLLDASEARQVYIWLNADLSDLLPAGSCDADRRLAARFIHIGQPVALAAAGGSVAGALRLCIGARLVSGEYSHRHLEPESRIEREIADALAVLEKTSLIVRHFERFRRADPRSRFR